MTEPAPGVDVFVSYKREDRDRVAGLVVALRAAGLAVWWDADIAGGATWRPEILRHLDAARCVIAVWSEASVGPGGEFVIEEAERARRRGVLLPIGLDPVAPPIGFGEIQTLDLTGWTGDPADPRILDVTRTVQAAITGAPRPPVLPRRRTRQWAGALAIAIVALITAFALDVAQLQSAVCSVPGVRFACGELGLGHVPSRAQQREWEARPPGDCAWLRTFAVQQPSSPYAATALTRLQAKQTVADEQWQPETHRVPAFVSMSPDGHDSRDAAQADALARAAKDAQQLCAGYGSPLFRLRSATLDTQSLTWHCETRSGRVRCAVEGQVACVVDARHTVTRDVCP